MAVSTLSINPSTLVGSDAAGCTTGTARAGLPDWALMCRIGRNSDRWNATTARSHTSEGVAVEVSFWLVDPPGISYFSVGCPGYQNRFSFSWLEYAEDAFVLFSITCRGSASIHYFVYTARGRGPAVTRPSLRPLPQPRPAFFGWQQSFGILPRGCEHYAVAVVDCNLDKNDDRWRFDIHIFWSETRAWRSSEASLAHLSKSNRRLCREHALSKQITVGVGSLGWVDSDLGILLLHNLFDEGGPVIDLIPLPRCAFPYFFYDVACCDDGLIKLVEIKHDGPLDFSTGGRGWRATVWNRRVSWDGWQKQCTVHVDDISVDPSYSALLPELRHDVTQELELKKLIFHGPKILSVNDEDILCMMAKVNDVDNNAWAITVDMKQGMVEALAQFPAKRDNILLAVYYCPCVFPKYLDIAPGGSSFFLHDDNSRGNLQKKRKKRTRSSRRRKKPVPVPDRRHGFLYLLCIVGCILIAITVCILSFTYPIPIFKVMT